MIYTHDTLRRGIDGGLQQVGCSFSFNRTKTIDGVGAHRPQIRCAQPHDIANAGWAHLVEATTELNQQRGHCSDVRGCGRGTEKRGKKRQGRVDPIRPGHIRLKTGLTVGKVNVARLLGAKSLNGVKARIIRINRADCQGIAHTRVAKYTVAGHVVFFNDKASPIKQQLQGQDIASKAIDHHVDGHGLSPRIE